MKNLLLALFGAMMIFVAAPHSARADGVVGVNGCGSTPVPLGLGSPLTVDSNTGRQCSNDAGGTGTGAEQVQGTAATGTTAIGNPVQVGCVYNSTMPTFLTGQIGSCQISAKGGLYLAFPNTLGNSGQTGTSGAFLDAVGNVRTLGTSNFLYNGATQDQNVSINGATANGVTGTGTTAIEEAGTSFSEIATATTTLVKSGATILHSVCINTHVASATIKVYNALTATGTPFTLTEPSTITGDPPSCLKYDVYFSTGITVVTSGASDVTVTFGR